MLTAVIAALAIVTQDGVALRASPKDSAAQQAVLWQGDRVEIRGEKGDFLQVYDHRRERAGYIRSSQLHPQSLSPEAAPEMLAVVRFLKDIPGSEALGISYANAYLQAAPAEAIDGEVFDAIGNMADRLARRATAGRPGKAGEVVAAHLEVAAQYGVSFNSYEREGQVQLCYEGEAARRVLARPASDAQKARAALLLTKHECVAPNLTPGARFALDQERAEILERVSLGNLPETLKNRLHLRRAGVWASLAYQRARRTEMTPESIRQAAQRAIDELAAVNKSELMESDQPAYAEAAIRVGASRWGAEPAVRDSRDKASSESARPRLVFSPGQPGETCLQLVEGGRDPRPPLLSRCTWSVVWPASATVSPDGKSLTLAVQPLDTWRELWLFRKTSEGWTLEVLPPGLESPTLGYLEFAGWVPGGEQLLAAREIKTDGRYQTRFEVINQTTLAVEKQADKPANLSPFVRWQSPRWRAQTVSIR